MLSPPISQVELNERIADHVEELLGLWWEEQGHSKRAISSWCRARSRSRAIGPFEFWTCAVGRGTWAGPFTASIPTRRLMASIAIPSSPPSSWR
jgi:hypothetical protein